MDPEFWHERWSNDEIGFHQPDFNIHMKAYTASLRLEAGAHVLVPLCGKSRDMVWLAGQGFRVTGIEINSRAVSDFFAENRLPVKVESHTGCSRYRSGPIEIWLTDFFHFDVSALPAIDAVYDRASLVALPREMRGTYAVRLNAMIPPGTPVLLVTLSYPEAEMRGPPFPVHPSEVHKLFGAGFDIEEVHSEDCLQREPRFRKKGLSRMVEHVFVMRKHG